MSTAELAEQIVRALPDLKTGTLRFWGDWFGRPYDNIHRIVGVSTRDETLTLRFNAGETLQVWNPVPGLISRDAFAIIGADRLRWEWFLYGRPLTSDNLCFRDFERTGGRVRVSTNWPSPSTKEIDPEGPAVELV